eukprot:TRINITY_DN4484_c0_g2_i2.p1 TRINITY_DN4484_c0_g2~~TRINITY_DN4484_c0_g2_i2.p1  ORF type:complete len:487 (-),score=67.63 TRINITY_DN4484_c0_g2_i2:251-1711(-)
MGTIRLKFKQMISEEQLKRHYKIEQGQNFVSTPKVQVDKVQRRVPLAQTTYNEVVIKRDKGIPFSIGSPDDFADSISKTMNGILSYYRAQSELVVNVEAMCFVPSLGLRAPNTIFLDKIIVMEYFGQDLTNDLAKQMEWSEQNIDKLVRFLIRSLRMMEQRGIIHGDIKPANIVRNNEFDFKLIDMDDSGFYRSEETVSTRGHTHAYASNIVRTNPSTKITAQEWRLNDVHCAAITLLQVILGLTNKRLEKIRDDDNDGDQSLYGIVIDSLPTRFPTIRLRLKTVVSMMIEGKDINQIAHAYDGNDSVLAKETFVIRNDQKVEDSIVASLKSKIQDEEIKKILTMLVKHSDLSYVADALKSLHSSSNSKAVKPLQTSFPLVSYKFKASAQKASLVDEIASKVREMNTPQTFSYVEVDWEEYPRDIKAECKAVLSLLSNVSSLQKLNFTFSGTSFNDEGCRCLAEFLKATTSLTHFTFFACRLTQKK